MYIHPQKTFAKIPRLLKRHVHVLKNMLHKAQNKKFEGFSYYKIHTIDDPWIGESKEEEDSFHSVCTIVAMI